MIFSILYLKEDLDEDQTSYLIGILQDEKIVNDELNTNDISQLLLSLLRKIDNDPFIRNLDNSIDDIIDPYHEDLEDCKYPAFIYFLIGNSVNITVDEITDSFFDEWIKLYVSVNLKPFNIDPHGGTFDQTYKFFLHDFMHDIEVIGNFNTYDLEDFKELYLKNSINKRSFNHRLISVISMFMIHESDYIDFMELPINNRLIEIYHKPLSQYLTPNDMSLFLKYITRAYDFKNYDTINKFISLDLPKEYKTMGIFPNKDDEFLLGYNEVWKYLIELFLKNNNIKIKESTFSKPNLDFSFSSSQNTSFSSFSQFK